MDSPYRAPPEAHAEAPRDQGIVGDVIGQFADPLAFYRELVQNAIDAGTDRVDIRIEHDAGAGAARVSVRDHGEGMSRDIVENQLLVLFRSTKEKDDTKIGKFGIGFASVLSPGPRVVTVHTARDGRRLALHLHPDLSYELFDAGPATRAGTTVELELPMGADAFGDFARRSQEALTRWCRHAAVPIELVVAYPGGPASVRIDRPLALDNPIVETRATSADGETTVVVGLTADLARGVSYGGFFDQGLTLYETAEPLLGRPLTFKIQDRRLSHTLSRDNVRRDGAFDRAVEFARRVAEDGLTRAAATALRAAAAAGDRVRYVELADAIGYAQLPLSPADWTFPLVGGGGGATFRRTIDGDQLGEALGAHRRSPITDALAAAGVPVVDVGPNGELSVHVVRLIGRSLVDAHSTFTLVTPLEPTDTDRALFDELDTMLGIAHRPPGEIALAILDGPLADRLAINGALDGVVRTGQDPGAPWLVDNARGARKLFGWFRRGPVVLSAGHPQVAAARALAATDIAPAAALLARLLLLDAGKLDVERSERLLEATLQRIGVEGSR